MTTEEILSALTEGKPIQLPCKLGDFLYMPYYHKKGGSWINKYVCTGFHVTDKVTNWHKDKTSVYLVARTESYGSTRHFDFATIGHTVFLSEEEAKKAINDRR